MSLSIKYFRGVDPELKSEILVFARWLRHYYTFETPLEIRLVPLDFLIDFDGTECALRWWQNYGGKESVKGEVAVNSFQTNLRTEGPTVAYPTVIAAISRVVKYYYLAVLDLSASESVVIEWGDKVLSAYIENTSPPNEIETSISS